MADNKASSKSKKSKERGKVKRVERTERRFVPERSNTAMLTMGGSIVGGLAVGAGVYGQWISDPRVVQAPWIVAGGAVVLAAVILWGDMEGTAVRVGDGGVALEKGGAVVRRVAWCEMREVSLKDGTVRLEAEGAPLIFKMAANPLGAAWVVQQAEERIPKRLKVEKSERDVLPEPKSGDGERVDVEPLQVTGRACRASDQVITFERDARFCLRCGEVYHKDAMPARCMTCEGSLADGKWAAG